MFKGPKILNRKQYLELLLQPPKQSVVADVRRDIYDPQVLEIIQDLRSAFDHQTHVNIWINVPVCESCRKTACQKLRTDIRLKKVSFQNWEDEYISLGIAQDKIVEANGAIEAGTWHGPFCQGCCLQFRLRDQPGYFYLECVTPSELYNVPIIEGKRPPKWMREVMFAENSDGCAACPKSFSSEDLTFDHIVARDHGGQTSFENLQILCRKCNQIKANSAVKRKEVKLSYLLLPASLHSHDADNQTT